MRAYEMWKAGLIDGRTAIHVTMVDDGGWDSDSASTLLDDLLPVSGRAPYRQWTSEQNVILMDSIIDNGMRVPGSAAIRVLAAKFDRTPKAVTSQLQRLKVKWEQQGHETAEEIKRNLIRDKVDLDYLRGEA